MNKESKNIYFFIGIGGVGMSALASLCLDNGYQVYGYDKTSSQVTQKLIQKWLPAFNKETRGFWNTTFTN